jgi:hypothetical protein
MNRWGVRAFFLSAGEKLGAMRKNDINNSTPMVYNRMLCPVGFLFSVGIRS